jgi:hypothetical protein
LARRRAANIQEAFPLMGRQTLQGGQPQFLSPFLNLFYEIFSKPELWKICENCCLSANENNEREGKRYKNANYKPQRIWPNFSNDPKQLQCLKKL